MANTTLFLGHCPTRLVSKFRSLCVYEDISLKCAIVNIMDDIGKNPNKITRLSTIRPRSEKTSTIYLRGVPPHIKKRFKSSCLQNRKTMTGVILATMKERINGYH